MRSTAPQSKERVSEATPGYQIRIEDPALQAYLQRYPFATGPDAVKNEAGREAILHGLRVRPMGQVPREVLLDREQTALPEQEQERLGQTLEQLGLDPARQAALIDDFGWEANLIPREARRVLVLGCGDGMELLFLRAVLPTAEIVATDYHDSLTPAVKQTVGLTFLQGDMNAHLRELTPGFDLVMSNHTMEHFYTPDEVIAKLFSLLAPRGTLIGTLPMDGKQGSPFLEQVQHAVQTGQVKPTDIVFLDAGHPWKTTPADLEGTLRRAGFGDVTLFQRAHHLSRPVQASPEDFQRGRERGLRLHRRLFRWPRALASYVPSDRLRRQISRLLLAAERRVWFGSNNLKNRYVEEALVHATKPG